MIGVNVEMLGHPICFQSASMISSLLRSESKFDAAICSQQIDARIDEVGQ